MAKNFNICLENCIKFDGCIIMVNLNKSNP